MPQENAFRGAVELLKLDRIDSTNNYAMQLIDTDAAVHGLTITAKEQLSGRGQRGKTWTGTPGDALMMSVILKPTVDLGRQADFLALIAVSVARAVQKLIPGQPVRIKWPNDIIVADKKAAGILIENVVRGQTWPWAVVGIGLNVGPERFPPELPNATSLRQNGYTGTDLDAVALIIRDGLVAGLADTLADPVASYNEWLMYNGQRQLFRKGDEVFSAVVEGMNRAGQLMLRHHNGVSEAFNHGTIEHIWT